MTDASATQLPRVLLVEDNVANRRTMARALTQHGFDVGQASDGSEALEMLVNESFDVVVSDVRMPRLSGVQLLQAIREHDLELPVILITGAPDPEIEAAAIKLGVIAYLAKPVANEKLVAAVSRAAKLGQLASTKREAMDALGSGLPRAGDKTGLDGSLSRALEGMWMAFQPIVRAEDGSLFGYEALMRSEEPSLPHPGAILDAAERLGRLDEVGRQVRSLAPACFSDAADDALFFVNLHSADLMDESLFAPGSPLALAAKRVVLEITERSTLDGVSNVVGRIARLRETGFRIAVDDLGAGYAGLTSFALLEPDIAKIDMSLVRGIDTTVIKQKLCRSLVSTCRDLGVTVVAEGIETIAERDCLRDMGCDLFQGYLLARPGRPFPTAEWP